MLETLKKGWQGKTLLVIFLLLILWGYTIYPVGGEAVQANYIFAATYGLVALLGGIWGLGIAEKWGGYKSLVGRGIIFLSLGLLAQEFGQLAFSAYYFLLKVEIPYPSLADIGFFGAIPLYIFGISSIAKAAGSQFGLSTFKGRLQAFLLPLALLLGSYFVFLTEYDFEATGLQTFLDFGYPLGQAVYISIALLTYTLSKSLLGGAMRSKILFIVWAFIAQYVADFNFLTQNSRGTWANGGYGDFLYLLAYFLMAFGILQLQSVITSIKEYEQQ